MMKTILFCLAMVGLVIFFLAAVRAVAGGAEATSGGSEKGKPKRISLEEFDRLRSNTNCVVLDVRTAREFASGHVPGAVNIDWMSSAFTKRVAELDTNNTYLVHCASGFRSARAVTRMHRQGFKELYDFSGGWSEWKKASKPVER